ncbi:FUSC family protein [Psychrobacter ciconiae]|uniref:FUSC family protein n=1 Tax=Psychrobacter ciconiae TaxID=1553449 RepID=UPI0019192A45|nr:FUSC family protein [Psychrobacter ciconiae]
MISDRARQLFQDELRHLFTINKSRRPWHMPIIAALTISFPVFVGAYFGALPSGIKASLGAMVILNTPLLGRLGDRIVTLMAWGFAMSFCFALGLVAQQLPVLRLPVFAILSFGVVLFGRYYQQAPPAGLFILMAAAIALFIPVPLEHLFVATGMVMLGSGFAIFIGLLYSLFLVASRPVLPKPELGYVPDTISESLMITLFVIMALSLALLLNMSNPYWAAVSCFIILQGIHLRSMWIKQFHRLLGTSIGMVLSGWLLSLGLGTWGVAAMILAMMLCIESMIDRHYAIAVIFITPLTIFIAEFGSGLPVSAAHSQAIINARLLDTVLGCAVGFAGGWVIHSTKLQAPFQKIEAYLLAKFS